MSAQVFVKLLVIFAVVAIGWAVARSGRLGNDATRTLSSAAFYIFVPALLFRTTSRIDFARLDAAVLLAFFLPTLALLGIVYAFERRRSAGTGSAPAGPSVRAINASFGNTVQVGIPLAAALFGETGLALHVTIISLHGLTLLTVLTALAETDLALARHRPAGSSQTRLVAMLGATVRNTVIHPVVLPVLAGLACNASGVEVPAFADDVLVLLGQAVVPVCLILIGVSLSFYGVRGSLRAAARLSLLKLVAHPLAVLAVAHWGFGLTGTTLAVLVMMAALPVGSNALVFAQRYDTLQAESSTAIVCSTLGFVATAPLWLLALQAAG